MTFAPAAGHQGPPSARAAATPAAGSTASTSSTSGISGAVGAAEAGGPRLGRTGRVTAVVFIVALLIYLANSGGQVFFDTKLGVDLDPAGFLTRLWHLWNGDEWFGTLQDQYIGYAFPMAPFYLAGQLLQVPVWITERIWLAALTAAGFGGLVTLAEALRIGTSRSRVVAGLAFALWPTFTIVIGSTSAGILPGLLLPWAVLPLVRAAVGGSLPRAAARSGLAVLFMGGVNATSTLAVLILPAVFIVTAFRGPRRVAMAALWAVAVLVATAWWIGPLLLQAKYSYNFLPYIEQSQTTTATMSAATFLRGSGNWTAYLNLGQPWLRAGWAMVTFPVTVLAAALAAGTGLFGVARRDLPRASWLRISLGIAALLALAGYPGPLGGPAHHPVDQLLNGAAAPLRSVYKLEPIAAVVLALGIAHALVLRTKRAAVAADPVPRTLLRLFAVPVIGLVLLGLAWPQVSGQVLNAGSFRAMPLYWYRAAAYLATHSPRAPALVVPAAAHGTYLWGEPVDDALEPLASSPWTAQGLVPYGGAGSELLMRSINAALNLGERIPGLAATLHRSGIGYVVVRNDLSPSSIGYVQPQVIHRALESSGFHRVAAFGGRVTGAQTDPGAGNVQYALPSYPAVEIFAAGPAGTPPPAAAVALPAASTVLVNGGPDALLQLIGQNVLPASAPAIIAGDPAPARPALWAISDTLRRADHAFGMIDPSGTYTYTARQNNPPDNPLGNPGGAPRQMLPVTAAGHQTVAVISGAASVTASSSGSWLAETPQIDPVNVFDGNQATVWTEADPVSPVGQWVQITFGHRITVPGTILVRLLNDSLARPVASKLTVGTENGTRTTSLRRTGAAQALRVAPGPTRTLRITIAAVRGGVAGGPGAGLAGVSIPGVTVTRYLQPPQSIEGRTAAAVAFSFQRQVPSPASLVNLAAYPPMARQFSTEGQAAYRFGASAIAVPGHALNAILAGLTPVRRGMLEVTASSTYGSLPSFAPANLFRSRNPGSWIAGGRNAALNLSWHGARTIRRMTILSLPGFAAAPKTVKITSPDGVRYASVGLDGLTEIVPPLTTTRMSISFPVLQYATASQPVSGQLVQLPVGLSGLSIPALNGLSPATPDPSASFSLPCGSGPRVNVDGRGLRTRVSGRVGALISFQPVHVSLCGATSLITLGPGTHRVLASRPGAFSLTDLSLVAPSPAAAAGSGRHVRVLAWQPEFRKLRVDAGQRAFLELHQNANAGWVASLDGKTLRPVRLDGWQQGYVLPAGSRGVVTLTFRPVKFYHLWIIVSAAGVLGLLAAAVVRRRRSMREPMNRPPAAEPGPSGPPGPGGEPDRPATGWSAAGRAWPAGPGWEDLPAGRSVRAPSAARSRGAAEPGVLPLLSPGQALRHGQGSDRAGWRAVPTWLGLGALAGLLAVAGGPMVLAVPFAVALAYYRPRWSGLVAFAAMTASGLLTVLAAHPAQPGTGAFGGPAQACALVALTVALVPVLPARRRTP